MAHLAVGPSRRFGPPGSGGFQANHDDDDSYDDEDDDSISTQIPADKIRRNYQLRAGMEQASSSSASYQVNGNQETIRVHLNESYFAHERRQLVGLVSDVRQKLNSFRMFNPVKNQEIIEQQQEWSEKVSTIMMSGSRII